MTTLTATATAGVCAGPCSCPQPKACRQPANDKPRERINHPRSEQLIVALHDAIECVIELNAFHRSFCKDDCCDCPDMDGYLYVLRSILSMHGRVLFTSDVISRRQDAHEKWLKDFWAEKNWPPEAEHLARILNRQQREMRRREMGHSSKPRKQKPAVQAPALAGAMA